MKGILNTIIIICVLLQFGHLHGQRVIDTFLIEDLTGEGMKAENYYHLHEDDQHYYYMVEKDMFDVDRGIVNGEIVYTVEQNEFRYDVQGETIEVNTLPSKIDTLGGGYVLLTR